MPRGCSAGSRAGDFESGLARGAGIIGGWVTAATSARFRPSEADRRQALWPAARSAGCGGGSEGAQEEIPAWSRAGRQWRRILHRFCPNYMFVLAPGATGNHLWASLSGIMLESTTVTPRGATPSLEAMSTSRHAMR